MKRLLWFTAGLAAACSGGGPPLLEVPYDVTLESAIQLDNVFVAENYGDLANTPTGKAHLGLHYSPKPTHDADMAYYAMADGTIAGIEVYSGTGKHSVNVQLDVGGDVIVVYQFETESTDPADRDAQLGKIARARGDTVRRGDLIGHLHDAGGPVPILHLGFVRDGELVCPKALFSADLLARSEALLRRDNPTWRLCYPDS